MRSAAAEGGVGKQSGEFGVRMIMILVVVIIICRPYPSSKTIKGRLKLSSRNVVVGTTMQSFSRMAIKGSLNQSRTAVLARLV